MMSPPCRLCRLTAARILPIRRWACHSVLRRPEQIATCSAARRKVSISQRVACSAAEKAEQLQNQEGASDSQADTVFKQETAEVTEVLDTQLLKVQCVRLQSLREIVGSVSGIGPTARVVGAGSRIGGLIPILQERGVEDILLVDEVGETLEALKRRHGQASLGNERKVRTWRGDIGSVPAYQGPFNAAFFDATFGSLPDQRDALLHAALLLQPGGRIVVSHPFDRQSDPRLVHQTLPDKPALERLIWDLPLQLEEFRDNEAVLLAVLQVPPGYRFSRAPIRLEEEVVTGFGRGSKQMGVPTANLAPEALFAGPLDGLPLGVYFGWVQLQGPSGPDGAVHKTVLNIGRRPTIEDGEQRTIELHILHHFSQDFYEQRLRVVILGFIRPEMRFGSLDTLINRIKADTGIAKSQLDLPLHAAYAQDSLFSRV